MMTVSLIEEAAMLHATQPRVAPEPAHQESAGEVVANGLVAGFIGYATVALLIGVIDVAQGRSFFFTAAMLGEAMFHGLTDPANVVVEPGAVFAYNGLHLLTFLAIGLSAAWLAHLAERGAQLWFPAVVLFLFIVAHAFGAVLLMTEELRAVLPAWLVGVPTLVALLAMAAYLMAVHPGLRRKPGEWND
jgi:hypothetical protein